MINMKNLKLKAARASFDMSHQDLADKVGVSGQTINAIENDPLTPSRGFINSFRDFSVDRGRRVWYLACGNDLRKQIGKDQNR